MQSERKVHFSDHQLWAMILPLVMERLMLLLVGMVDSVIISYAGEDAVSGVALVNQFNNLFMMISTAMAAGGAVVVSQYIGNRQKQQANRAGSQLLMFSAVFAIGFMVVVALFDTAILGLLFGKVEPAVMTACIIYLRITLFSYPAQAIYDAGAALYRSMGRTSVTLKISVVSNLINLVGNIVMVFCLKMGVAGVAIPTLVSRVFSAVAITLLCLNKSNKVHYSARDVFMLDWPMLKRVWGIALPNSVENGTFNLVKITVTTFIAGFGTYQIAANGIGQNLWNIANVCSNVMGPVFITVIGQCMGAREIDTAKYYYGKLLKTNLLLSVAWNLLVLACTPLVLHFYAVSPEAKALVWQATLVHNLCNALISPFAMPLGAGLRAAGDVKFTMSMAMIASVVVRLSLSQLLGVTLGFGLLGVTVAMVCDWIFRAIMYYARLRSGKWQRFAVI